MRMRNERSVRAVFGMLGLAVLMTVGSGTVASAAISDCPAGYSCLWEDSNYKTNGYDWDSANFQLYHTNFRYWDGFYSHPHVNDKVSSLYNNGRVSTAWYYVNSGFSGSFFLLARGSGDGDLGNSIGNAPGGFNDELSSACFSDWC